jgi:hypothetical protein
MPSIAPISTDRSGLKTGGLVGGNWPEMGFEEVAIEDLAVAVLEKHISPYEFLILG